MLARASGRGRGALAALAAAAWATAGAKALSVGHKPAAQLLACVAAARAATERRHICGRGDSAATSGNNLGEDSTPHPAPTPGTAAGPAAAPELEGSPANIQAELCRVETRLAKLYADSAALRERESALAAAEEQVQR